MRYEVINPDSGQSLGVYDAENEEQAIEACVRDAGYRSVDDMLQQLGHDRCELRAVPAQD